MKKCLVIGGGLAGLSSAAFLTQNGFIVELIEASPKLGGRTYSFLDKKNNTEIDNGQHILMGSYKETFKFLELINSINLPEYQTNLEVEYFKINSNKYLLKASNNIYPINLIFALFQFKAISIKERISVLNFLIKFLLQNKNRYKGKNAEEILISENQTKNIIKSIWEPIAVSALNTNLNEASAEIFLFTLKKIFFDGNRSSTIVLPKVSLNKLFIKPIEKYFKENHVNYCCSESLIKIITGKKKIIKVITSKRELENFDFYILAIPNYKFKNLKSNIPIVSGNVLDITSSPIITIHIWLKNKIDIKKFAGLIDSKIHWIFNNNSHFSVVISAADELISLSNQEILNITVMELSKYIRNVSIKDINDFKILKEKRATFKCTNENEIIRATVKSNLSNLAIAGDWTNTKLPGTIEGAILSGKIAANTIINNFNTS